MSDGVSGLSVDLNLGVKVAPSALAFAAAESGCAFRARQMAADARNVQTVAQLHAAAVLCDHATLTVVHSRRRRRFLRRRQVALAARSASPLCKNLHPQCDNITFEP